MDVIRADFINTGRIKTRVSYTATSFSCLKFKYQKRLRINNSSHLQIQNPSLKKEEERMLQTEISNAEVKYAWNYSSATPYLIKTWCLIKARVTLAFSEEVTFAYHDGVFIVN
jgi:hypothetical protein